MPSALLERLQEHHSSLSVSDESIVSDINFNSEDSSVSIDENNNDSTHTSANSTDVDEGDHSKCAKCRLNAASQPLSVKDEDTLHHLRIELIKAQILSKLKLEQPPKVSKSERIPDEIFKELSESDAQVEEEEPTKASLSTKIVVANASEYAISRLNIFFLILSIHIIHNIHIFWNLEYVIFFLF